MPLFGQTQTKPGTQHGPANPLGGLERVFNPFAGYLWYKNGGAGPQLTGQMPTGTGVLPGNVQHLPGNTMHLKGNTLNLTGRKPR
jgi:hypothetical protein